MGFGANMLGPSRSRELLCFLTHGCSYLDPLHAHPHVIAIFSRWSVWKPVLESLQFELVREIDSSKYMVCPEDLLEQLIFVSGN
jgi:hypothetical protein